MGLEDLYREVILDHYRTPRNHGALSDPTDQAEGVNPLCGDEIAITLRVDDGIVTDIGFSGQGCSISQSSASMMTEAVKGKSIEEVASITERFRTMMSLDDGGSLDLDPARPGAVLGDLEALQGVRQYPVRIKCASLGWTVLGEALTHSDE